MKRKIIYIVLVILFAIVVTILTNGCTSQAKEKAAGAGAEQQEVKQAVSQNQNEEALKNETDSTTKGATVQGYAPTVKDTADSTTIQQTTQKKYVTISISCVTIYDNLEAFDKSKREILPENGLIVPVTKVEISKGETVFDVLLKVTKGNKIHMEYVSTPLYKSNYIEGIGNIYEIDAGPLSGWMYKVNNQFPSYGCGRYVLKDGDNIEWVYTCDLGRDVGGDWNEQNK